MDIIFGNPFFKCRTNLHLLHKSGCFGIIPFENKKNNNDSIAIIIIK